MNALLPAALLMGAAGSAHCVGMCGPIAMAVPAMGPGKRERWASTLLLNGGRLVSYVALGLAFGSFGQGLRLAGLQRWVSLAAGLLLLLAVLVPGLLERWGAQGKLALLIGRLRGRLAKHLRRTAPEAIFLTGLLNGLLPCGLVYAAALGAAATGSALLGALFMALFALGTWPALIALRMGSAALSPGLRSWLRRSAPAVVTCMAVLLIIRGSGFGIPFLSPSLPDVPTSTTTCHQPTPTP